MHAANSDPGSTSRPAWDYVSGMFFDGFVLDETGPIRMRRGGSGPPLLLLHGQPQSHAMWHAVAARLADRFTLVCPDLAPERAEAALAADMLALMRSLGHEQFGVAGHDFGARGWRWKQWDHALCHAELYAQFNPIVNPPFGSEH